MKLIKITSRRQKQRLENDVQVVAQFYPEYYPKPNRYGVLRFSVNDYVFYRGINGDFLMTEKHRKTLELDLA